jgi:hypothetical protein
MTVSGVSVVTHAPSFPNNARQNHSADAQDDKNGGNDFGHPHPGGV